MQKIPVSGDEAVVFEFGDAVRIGYMVDMVAPDDARDLLSADQFVIGGEHGD
jgi:hypothetical protein